MIQLLQKFGVLSALAESKMIRAGLVFAFGKNNKQISNQPLKLGN